MKVLVFEPGDPVYLAVAANEFVEGEVVNTDLPDVFGVGLTMTAVITEGGHPRFGKVGAFRPAEVASRVAE